MQFIKKKYKRSFTLAELLIVTIIMSVISFAMYSTFASGVKIWQRTSIYVVNEDIDIFFDKFSTDVRNSFRFGQGGFSCQKDNFRFYSLVASPELKFNCPGEISYYLDLNTSKLTRQSRDYAQIFSGSQPPPRAMVKDIAKLAFSYYAYDKEGKIYHWEDELSGEETPLAVRLEFSLKDGISNERFIRTVFIPIAQ